MEEPMITSQRWQEIGEIFKKWTQPQKESFCLFYVLTARGTDGTPPNAELQERIKKMMAKMGVTFEEFQEIEQRMSQEERQTFFGEAETKA